MVKKSGPVIKGKELISNLSPESKAKADKLTFEICAEFVAMEIAGMFRRTINRNLPHK